MPTVETVTINSVPFPTAGAWEAQDLTPLLTEGDSRGRDLVIPGSDGLLYRARAGDGATVAIPLFIYGEKNSGGGNHPDPRTGLKDNVVYLNTQLLAHNVGAVTCTVTYPDATTLSGSVAVESLNTRNLNDRAEVLVGVLRVVLLDGKLA